MAYKSMGWTAGFRAGIAACKSGNLTRAKKPTKRKPAKRRKAKRRK